MTQIIEICIKLPEGERVEDHDHLMAFLVSTLLGCREMKMQCHITIDGEVFDIQVVTVSNKEKSKPS